MVEVKAKVRARRVRGAYQGCRQSALGLAVGPAWLCSCEPTCATSCEQRGGRALLPHGVRRRGRDHAWMATTVAAGRSEDRHSMSFMLCCCTLRLRRQIRSDQIAHCASPPPATEEAGAINHHLVAGNTIAIRAKRSPLASTCHSTLALVSSSPPHSLCARLSLLDRLHAEAEG